MIGPNEEDDRLHRLARQVADTLSDPDKKQLKFNEIVSAAKEFYPLAVEEGVVELVQSCDRMQTDLYVSKSPMWEVLNEQYRWMIGHENLS